MTLPILSPGPDSGSHHLLFARPPSPFPVEESAVSLARPEPGRFLHATTRSGEEAWLLRPEEVAELFSISRSKVYQLIASRRLKSVTIDGSRRIRREDAHRFLIDSMAQQR